MNDAYPWSGALVQKLSPLGNGQIHMGIHCSIILGDCWHSKLLDSAAVGVGGVADFHNCIVAGSKFAV